MSRKRNSESSHRWVLAIGACGFVALVASGLAFTNANIVPATRADDDNRAVVSNDKKPDQCASISITNLISGSGNIDGTSGNDLILGGSANDTIRGGGGNDCIVGGGGPDTIQGQGGTDVCIGGAGNDNFASCETQIQ